MIPGIHFFAPHDTKDHADTQENKDNALNNPVLEDEYGRVHNYLRVSVTDRCNLRCAYCMPEGIVRKLRHDRILRYEEILRVIQTGASLGIRKVRITGGEPFVRKGLLDFICSLTGIPGIEEVTLTTNGVLLKDYLGALLDCGVKRLNISLDTLMPDKFRFITGKDCFHRVYDAIFSAVEKGFSPVKINMVVLKGINDDEIQDMAGLSLNHPLHVRFIEYMPFESSCLDENCFMPSSEIISRVREKGEIFPVSGKTLDGPAKRFTFAGGKGEIGFISPISHHFCSTCNRLRLTADGRIKPCLLSEKGVDILPSVRSENHEREIRKGFFLAMKLKSKRHHIASGARSKNRMSAIGG